MKTPKFITKMNHQTNSIAWAVGRLRSGVGKKGEYKRNNNSYEQRGVIFADGVGMGKTWEALGTVAVLLYLQERDKQNVNKRNLPHKILVLCPPGLVTKWHIDELENSGKFPAKLKKFVCNKKANHLSETFSTIFTIRTANDVPSNVSQTTKYDQNAIQNGTYICNWNVWKKSLESKGKNKLTLLKKTQWDAVIIDEAHHREARQIIRSIQAKYLLLLTATPFQLTPIELEPLLQACVISSLKWMSKNGHFSKYLKMMEDSSSDTKKLKIERDLVNIDLQQLICKNRPFLKGRAYWFIDDEGNQSEDENNRIRLIGNEVVEYLDKRLEIARNRNPMPSTKLRIYTGSNEMPRQEALKKWAIRTLTQNIRAFKRDGKPRKVIIFSSWTVNNRIDDLKKLLKEAWIIASDREKHLDFEQIDYLKKHLMAINDSRIKKGLMWPSLASCFKNKKYQSLVKKEINSLPWRDLNTQVGNQVTVSNSKRISVKKRIRAILGLLCSDWEPVCTHSGNDDRSNRDKAVEEFMSVMGPWIMIASNVGSEGIDLQKWTTDLVHFDIEWNPAKMEQREGRGDRIGRMHKQQSLNIYYLNLKDTYDERVYAQMKVRDKWHGHILGKKMINAIYRNDKDETDVDLCDPRSDLKPLELSPKKKSI